MSQWNCSGRCNVSVRSQYVPSGLDGCSCLISQHDAAALPDDDPSSVEVVAPTSWKVPASTSALTTVEAATAAASSRPDRRYPP